MNDSRSARQMVVPAFIAGITVIVGVSLWTLRSIPVPSGATVKLSWWGLALLFTLTQASVLNVQLRREARSIFLSEIPFLLGLLYVSGPGLFTARVCGAFVASVVFRRQLRSPAKLLFNTSLAAAEASTGLVCYRLVLWGGSPMVPRAWVAAVAGSVVACVAAALAVSLLIRALERMQRLSDVGRIVGSAAVQAAVIATVAVLVAASLAESPWAVFPLIVTTVVLVVAYRGYARLTERHTDLELLHGFTQVVASEADLDRSLHELMSRVTELLHAERARLTLIDVGEGRGEEIAFSDGELRTVAASDSRPVSDGGGISQHVISSAEAVLATRTTKDPAVRRWLEQHEVRETIAVPLRTDAGVFGVLAVEDRLGEARGFNTADMRFLETIATHVSITLHNGRLMTKLRHDALHDSLTGLPNRAYFQHKLDQALASPAGPHCTVGILDLDAFKDVNDTLGHHHGDELLCEVARRLTTASGERTLIARLGGDEFAILATGPSGDDDATRLAERLVACLREPMVIADVEVPLGASVGLALAPQHGATAELLLRRADLAMYAAKDLAAGVKIFEPDLDGSPDTKLALVARLRRAVENGDLEVYLQPKADLRTGHTHGAEALLRWRDERGTTISPEEFIPVAERSGLIRPLTELVLRRAVAACADWQQDWPGVGVAVNLSTRSLTDADLVQLVEQILTGYKLPPDLLTLELTEGSIMADTSRNFQVLGALRGLGVHLSVDDFGTGYSSLSYLRRLPVTEVKIDKSFVMRMAIDREDAAIVKSIIDLARNLHLQVVAEGIEDLATLTLLAEMGCDLGQGYYIARPMPSHRFADWLQLHTNTAGNSLPRLSLIAGGATS